MIKKKNENLYIFFDNPNSFNIVVLLLFKLHTTTDYKSIDLDYTYGITKCMTSYSLF